MQKTNLHYIHVRQSCSNEVKEQFFNLTVELCLCYLETYSAEYDQG